MQYKMAATVQRLGRLGSFKVFQVERWCVPRTGTAALFSSQAEEPTKVAKKTKAAGKTAKVPVDRATLLAYKTQVAFPVRLSNLTVTELLATTNTPAARVATGSEAAVQDTEATSHLELDSAHVVSDTVPPVADTRLTSEPLKDASNEDCDDKFVTAFTSENATTTKPASSKTSDLAAAGLSSSDSDSDSDSDTDSDSDSEKEKSAVKAEQIATLEEQPESTRNKETQAQNIASDVKDNTKEISTEAKATIPLATEVIQDYVQATSTHTHSVPVEPEKNTPDASTDDAVSLKASAEVEVAQMDTDHEVARGEAKPVTVTSPTEVSVDGTDEVASPVENTREKVEPIPVMAEESTWEKVEPAPVIAKEDTTKEKVEPAPVITEEESNQKKMDPAPVIAEERNQEKLKPAAVLAEGENTQKMFDPAPVVVEEKSKQDMMDSAPVIAEEESSQKMVDPAPVIAEEESNQTMVDPAPVIAEEELQGINPVDAPEETTSAAPPEPEEPFDNSTYKNYQHHSYTSYTFADLDLEMAKYRLPQPSSGRPSPRH